MAYTNNRFCWHGVISTDTAKTTPFYNEVLGWTSETVKMGDSDATFFAAADGKNRAHTRGPEMDGEPSHWNNYLRVENVDAAAKNRCLERHLNRHAQIISIARPVFIIADGDFEDRIPGRSAQR